MSTSIKHQNFIAEPMRDKLVTELPGIGDVLGGRLKDEGYDKAYVVLGQYLLFKKKRDLFEDWLKSTIKANSKQASDCYNALDAWAGQNL